MDFSSIPRALESLHRRQPPLPDRIISVSNDLYTLWLKNPVNDTSTTRVDTEVKKDAVVESTSSSSSSSKILKCLQELMGCSTTAVATTTSNGTTDPTMKAGEAVAPRWESVAVGLYIATELLIGISSSIASTTSATSTTTSSGSTTTTQGEVPVSVFHPHSEEGSVDNSSGIPVMATTNPTHHHHHPVYMDGPRVPSVTPIPTLSTGSSNSAATSSSTNNTHNVMTLSESDIVPLLHTMHQICMEHLEHSEPRLRTLVAKAIGAYTGQIRLYVQDTSSILSSSSSESLPRSNSNCKDTTNVTTKNRNHEALHLLLTQIHDKIVQSIEHHIKAGRDCHPITEETPTPNTAFAATTLSAAVTATTATTTTTITANTTTTPTTLVDDTTGWRAIETNWFALASFIHGLADQYYNLFPLVQQEATSDGTTPPILLTHFAYCSIQHVNRHVRAAAMQTYEQLIHAITSSIIQHHNESLKVLCFSTPTASFRTTLIEIVKTGLADNWSQVRMASSVLCRVWFQSLQTLHIPIDEPIMMSALLPRMCLNRFYMAPGVKLYSHETWKLIFGSTTTSTDEPQRSSSGSSWGLQLVAKHINAMTRYYIKMCDADNHEVREAACQAIAELAIKVGTHEEFKNRNVLDAQQIQNFITVLSMCFYDESWPVRDEACVTCGVLCKAFPQACHSEIFQKTSLWHQITEQVTDQIWSVRENAAVAIADIIEGYGEEILPQVQTLITTILPRARDQPPMSASEYRAYIDDLKQKANQEMNNGENAATNLRRGGLPRFGCVDCFVDRPKAPWEATDGCIYLIRECVIRRTLSGTTMPIFDDELIPICTELADVCRVRHFPQSDDLRSTLWKCLPVIAAALGKQRFKNQYLDIFLDLLMRNLESSSASPLSIHAAGQCAEELADLIGRNMFRARLEDHHRRIFDQIVQERQMVPRGITGGNDIFSPFAPSVHCHDHY